MLILLLLTATISWGAASLYSQFSASKGAILQANNGQAVDAGETISDSTVEKSREFIEYIRQNYYLDTTDVDFESGIYSGIFESLDDPYSVYMTEEEFTSFNESSEGSYGGIGIQIEPGKDNLITIVSPFEDTPGERAGLISGDKIVKVNGNDVYADALDEAVKQMKGEPGTDVTLTIYREGEDMFDVVITREQIVLKSVKSRVITADQQTIGYVRITGFDSKVYSEFVSHYKELKSQNVNSLIIDLRNNPGGSLQQCVQLADFILGEQLIVYTKNKTGTTEEYKSDSNKIELPIAVLVNGGSASASEILTGAIKDSKSGTVIGTTTFGKGLVQSVIPLPQGDGIKLTTAQYFTPNGTYIHGVGIEPDIVLEQSEDYVVGEDDTDVQLQKAIEVLTQ